MLFIILLLFVVILFHVYQRYRMRDLPPYFDGAMPIIGHSIYALLAKNYHTLITGAINKALERRTDIIRVRLGIWDINVIVSPEDAYLVANSCLEKDTLYDIIKPYLGEGLLSAPVAIWKIHRKMIVPTFNQRVLDEYLQQFNSKSRNLLDAVAERVGKGPFDHSSYMMQTVLEMIYTTAMGSSIDAEDEVTRKLFVDSMKEILTELTDRVVKVWLHSNLIYKLSGRKKHSDILAGKMKQLSQTILDKQRAQYNLKNQIIGPKQRKPFKSFIELLLELSEDGSLTDREISDELNTFIVAGTETLATTSGNLLTCVGNDSAIQNRILEELKEVFEGSDRDVDIEDLPRLKYMEAVIKETLRMYPPASVIGRIVDKEIKIKGYTLPAGSKCFFALYGVLRHWSWGPDAHQFRPERWLDGSLPDNMKGFPAFGIGKRNCVGYTYVIMVLKTILAHFLRRYSISSDTTKIVYEFNITTRPISGHEITIENGQYLLL